MMTKKDDVKNVKHISKQVLESSSRKTIALTVNGKQYNLRFGDDVEPWESPAYDVYPWDTLAHTLRERLGLTGTKVACDNGACGSCTVLMNGNPILSCSTLTVDCDGQAITTIEGLGNPVTGELHPIQQAFIDHHGAQCGFCIPGMILSSKALLDRHPHPTEEEVKEGLSGNLCRCGNYSLILKSVMAAAETIRRKG
jgi:aerobic-type carbon monoxide dehydrogenase small subunit (CoxS/CutS family)